MDDHADEPSDISEQISRVQLARTLSTRKLTARVHSVPTIGSTNTALVELARAGAPAWTVFTADQQTAGRGRGGRTWVSAPGTGLWMSVLVDPPEPTGTAKASLVPLVAGLALYRVLRRDANSQNKNSPHENSPHEITLKWPNDVITDAGKLAGILIDVTGGRYVIGMGINIEPGNYPGAVSMRELGVHDCDRGELLARIVTELHHLMQGGLMQGWDNEAIRSEYEGVCASIGASLRITEPGAEPWTGTGVGIDADGHLLVAPTPGSEKNAPQVRTVVAADVVHATISPCTPKSSSPPAKALPLS